MSKSQNQSLCQKNNSNFMQDIFRNVFDAGLKVNTKTNSPLAICFV